MEEAEKTLGFIVFIYLLFEINISISFKDLRDDKDFFDVTLACNGNQLQAHKVILSACSPFFRSILKKYPHPHPLLYLKGVQYEEIQSVLTFMYHGEGNVAQKNLNTFLAVADDLEMKGLSERNKPETKRQSQALSPQHRAENKDITRKKEIQEIVPRIKTEVPVILDDCITQPEVFDEMEETEDYPSFHDEYGG